MDGYAIDSCEGAMIEAMLKKYTNIIILLTRKMGV